MPKYVVMRVYEALNSEGKSIQGSRILVLRVTYKGDVADDKESPSSYLIMKRLEAKGAQISYNNSFVSEIKKFENTGN